MTRRQRSTPQSAVASLPPPIPTQFHRDIEPPKPVQRCGDHRFARVRVADVNLETHCISAERRGHLPAASPSRSATTTAAPPRTNRRAQAAPIPEGAASYKRNNKTGELGLGVTHPVSAFPT